MLLLTYDVQLNTMCGCCAQYNNLGFEQGTFDAGDGSTNPVWCALLSRRVPRAAPAELERTTVCLHNCTCLRFQFLYSYRRNVVDNGNTAPYVSTQEVIASVRVRSVMFWY